MPLKMARSAKAIKIKQNLTKKTKTRSLSAKNL